MYSEMACSLVQVVQLAGEAGHCLGQLQEGEETAWVMELSSVLR